VSATVVHAPLHKLTSLIFHCFVSLSLSNALIPIRPHCDGSCDNSHHVSTGRVATAVLYCQVLRHLLCLSPNSLADRRSLHLQNSRQAATRGGATTFSKSDIFVVPKRGQATFFSYKGPDGRMDDGYTEHSGCPVLDGEYCVVGAYQDVFSVSFILFA